jgi:hypothetical protein
MAEQFWIDRKSPRLCNPTSVAAATWSLKFYAQRGLQPVPFLLCAARPIST